MKVAVIGCTHAGTAAIVNTAQLYPDAQITVYERNDNISFLSCGIALYVGESSRTRRDCSILPRNSLQHWVCKRRCAMK